MHIVVARAQALLASVLVLGTASAGVIRVDAAGGGDFTNLQLAIDASVAGDILLVRPGSYLGSGQPTVLVVGKGITITADPPTSTFQLNTRIVIDGVPAGQTATLRGATTPVHTPIVGALAPGIVVTKCFGAVLIEDCIGEGSIGVGGLGLAVPGSAGILVEHSAAVSVVRSTGRGGVGVNAVSGAPPGSNPASSGGPGIRVFASQVALHDCTFTGGKGGNASGSFPAAPGGPGGLIETAFAFGAGSSFTGATPNGNGLAIVAPVAPIRCLDTTFTAVGLGAGVLDPANALVTIPGAARHFLVSSPVREGASASVVIDGEPGDAALLFIGTGVGSIEIPNTVGYLQVALPIQAVFALGSLPAPDGVLSFSAPAPNLVLPSLLGFASILQPYFVAGSDAIAGPPSSFVLVDSSL
ncbi:MAG: hypothetical protein JNL94_12120 [Planctomycetes bacterium]|nr:hypothetical protein [Planctomycetota bacterium]